jgi:hypothetical protein
MEFLNIAFWFMMHVYHEHLCIANTERFSCVSFSIFWPSQKKRVRGFSLRDSGHFVFKAPSTFATNTYRKYWNRRIFSSKFVRVGHKTWVLLKLSILKSVLRDRKVRIIKNKSVRVLHLSLNFCLRCINTQYRNLKLPSFHI